MMFITWRHFLLTQIKLHENEEKKMISTRELQKLCLQGFQLGLGDPKILGKADPRVESRTQWMINKANLHRIFNSRADQPGSWSSDYTLGGEPVASNVAAMDKDDNYVVLVTSINTWFGSNVRDVPYYHP